MQEALAKFCAKREFMECLYAQLIAMHANNFATYDEENPALIKLALSVNEPAISAIKGVKMMALALNKRQFNLVLQRSRICFSNVSPRPCTHPRTNQAQCCLTSVIVQELVFQVDKPLHPIISCYMAKDRLISIGIVPKARFF